MALLIAGAWACAQAQSLGTPVAEALLGRSLDMSVPARFTDGDNECVQADVFYGETRLSPNAVTTTITGPVDRRRIRVEATPAINEPIVTVSVRAGCRNTITRNYTLLPEYPSETLLAAIDARNAMASATPAVPLKLAKQAAPATSPRRAKAPSLLVARNDARADAAPAAVHTRAAATRSPRKESFKGPRLKLEPIDLGDAPQNVLRASNSLADPNGDPSRRATAALLWQAINADPQEVMRTTVMIHKLEQDLASLRLSAQQTRNEVAALRQRLDQAQPWYLKPGFVQLLALLVLAAAGAAGVLWWRMRNLRAEPEAWYLPPEHQEPVAVPQQDEAVAEDLVAPAPVVAPKVVPPVPVPAEEPVVAQGANVGPIDFDLQDIPAAAPVVAARASTDTVLRVEALAATFEEVEFLSSLGLTTDAMDILKSYLQDSANPAPIAYLELMRLCEASEDPAAVATVRRRYAQAFRVEAPRLAQFTADGGLDSVPALSARITRAWGTPEALEAIEQALFEVPTPGAPLTLQAGRDLLALYDLALARAAETGTADEPAAPLAPWAHADDAHAAQAVTQQAADADGGRHFALDVDLSAPEAAPLPETQPMPELELAPMLAKLQADRSRELPARPSMPEDEDPFSAAVASERMPVSRY